MAIAGDTQNQIETAVCCATGHECDAAHSNLSGWLDNSCVNRGRAGMVRILPLLQTPTSFQGKLMSTALVSVGDSLNQLASRGFRRPPRTQSEAELERRAQAHLNASPHNELRSVQCEVHGDVLTLRGRVKSYYLKQLAQESIRGIDGIHRIVNQMVVDSKD